MVFMQWHFQQKRHGTARDFPSRRPICDRKTMSENALAQPVDSNPDVMRPGTTLQVSQADFAQFGERFSRCMVDIVSCRRNGCGTALDD
jgi:hypothetical protein